MTRWTGRTILAGFFGLFLMAPAFAAEFELKETQLDDLKAVIATVQSAHEVLARSRLNGTLAALLVKEGDWVQAGDKIAMVGDAKLGIKTQGLAARLQAADAALSKAQLDFSRAQELRQTGYGTQARLDEMKSALAIAEQNRRAALSEKEEVQQQSTEGAVLAPGTGRILKIPVVVGSVVTPGETIATLSQESAILRLELPERHARSLRAGDKVWVGARGLDEEQGGPLRVGVVGLVYPEIKGGRVIADVTVPDLGSYFVGERTRVYIATGKRAALVVPEAALFRRAGLPYVKLLGGSAVLVQPGEARDGMIEILSGLRSGDKIDVPDAPQAEQTIEGAAP